MGYHGLSAFKKGSALWQRDFLPWVAKSAQQSFMRWSKAGNAGLQFSYLHQ